MSLSILDGGKGLVLDSCSNVGLQIMGHKRNVASHEMPFNTKDQKSLKNPVLLKYLN